MSSTSASAPGKIILSGEYAVVFGKRGIAVPSAESVTVTWTEDASMSGARVTWDGDVNSQWISYSEKILEYLKPHTKLLQGTLHIRCDIPLGKGMGSSTALVIAVSRCLLGPECEEIARFVEDQINPGHSGIDFAVIWNNAPILFSRGTKPEKISLPKNILQGARLIDTESPNETTKELVAWMKTRGQEIEPALTIIGNCTERLLQGESLKTVMRDHHRAQVSLGVVSENAQKIIAEIETNGGAAKVIGAGGRSGGNGIVLVLR